MDVILTSPFSDAVSKAGIKFDTDEFIYISISVLISGRGNGKINK